MRRPFFIRCKSKQSILSLLIIQPVMSRGFCQMSLMLSDVCRDMPCYTCVSALQAWQTKSIFVSQNHRPEMRAMPLRPKVSGIERCFQHGRDESDCHAGEICWRQVYHIQRSMVKLTEGARMDGGWQEQARLFLRKSEQILQTSNSLMIGARRELLFWPIWSVRGMFLPRVGTELSLIQALGGIFGGNSVDASPVASGA